MAEKQYIEREAAIANRREYNLGGSYDNTELTVPQHDPVNHPDHYTRGGIECIDVIQAVVTDLPGKEAWLVGQIIKYVWRYRWKNGLEDLKKARFYLDRLIQEVQP